MRASDIGKAIAAAATATAIVLIVLGLLLSVGCLEDGTTAKTLTISPVDWVNVTHAVTGVKPYDPDRTLRP